MAKINYDMKKKRKEKGDMKGALTGRAEKEKHDSWATGKAVLLGSTPTLCTLAGQMG